MVVLSWDISEKWLHQLAKCLPTVITSKIILFVNNDNVHYKYMKAFAQRDVLVDHARLLAYVHKRLESDSEESA